MPVYSLPWDKQEQIKVCVALKNSSYCSFSDKDEIGRIEQNLTSYRDLTESDKQFLEKMISQYGSNIDL